MQRLHTQSVYDAALLKYNNSILKSNASTQVVSTLKTFLYGVNSSLPPTWMDDGF